MRSERGAKRAMPAGIVVTVVVAREPATEEQMAQYALIHVHDNTGRPDFGPGLEISHAEWTREYISGVGLMEALFGDDKLPPELQHARKFIARGSMKSERCGNPLDGYDYEDVFEVFEIRPLPGLVDFSKLSRRVWTWELDEPIGGVTQCA